MERVSPRSSGSQKRDGKHHRAHRQPDPGGRVDDQPAHARAGGFRDDVEVHRAARLRIVHPRRDGQPVAGGRDRAQEELLPGDGSGGGGRRRRGGADGVLRPGGGRGTKRRRRAQHRLHLLAHGRRQFLDGAEQVAAPVVEEVEADAVGGAEAVEHVLPFVRGWVLRSSMTRSRMASTRWRAAVAKSQSRLNWYSAPKSSTNTATRIARFRKNQSKILMGSERRMRRNARKIAQVVNRGRDRSPSGPLLFVLARLSCGSFGPLGDRSLPRFTISARRSSAPRNRLR